MSMHGFRGWIGLGLVIGGASLAGCDEGRKAEEPAGFELVGSWTSGFGDETISQTRWDGFCLQAVRRYDNDANVAILETTGGEGCGNGFSRVVWKDIVGGAFDYCTTAFGEATVEAAEGAPTTAVSDDLTSGCGGFPWSHLTRK